MSYVIYNVYTTKILQAPARSVGCYIDSYKSESAAKAALTRLDKKGKLGDFRYPHEGAKVYPNGLTGTEWEVIPWEKDDFAIAEARDFYSNIEEKVIKRNLMTGEEFEIGTNSPGCVDPSTETYWSM
jgi:hypothetical protein